MFFQRAFISSPDQPETAGMPGVDPAVQAWAEADAFEDSDTEVQSLTEEEWLADGDSADLAQGEEKPVEGEAKPEEAKKAETAGPKEFVFTGEDGKKYKAKLDVSDASQVQGVLKEAARVPGLRAQLEEAKTQAAEATEMRQELADIQSLGEEKGIAGIVDYLMDEDGHFEKYIESERQRRNLLDSAEPHERDEAKRLADIEARERRTAAREKRIDEQAKKAEADKNQAGGDRLQSMFTNAWGKHDLSGTLGDAELEESLNSAAFEAINREVQERVQKGQHPTQADMHAIVERRFGILKRGLKEGAKRTATQDSVAAKAQASAAIGARVAPAAPAKAGQQEVMTGFKEGKLSFRDMVAGLLKR